MSGKEKRTVLVTGATGEQGSAVAGSLLRGGHHVRALTRDPNSSRAQSLGSLGAEIAKGDFNKPETVRAAARGTDAVYVMAGPLDSDPDTEIEYSISTFDAVAESNTSHIVYASVASALDGTGVPHFESKAIVERELQNRRLSWTVVAPVAFLSDLTEAPFSEGTGSPHWRGLIDGVYAFPLPENVPLQMVSLTDLGELVRLVVEQPKSFKEGRIEVASIEVTGPEIAAALSEELGTRIRYEEVSLDFWRELGGEDGVKMVEFFRRGGYTVDIATLHAAYPEVAWHSLADWVKSHPWQDFHINSAARREKSD